MHGSATQSQGSLKVLMSNDWANEGLRPMRAATVQTVSTGRTAIIVGD